MISNAVASALTPAEQASRAAAVILNKVENLKFYYFKVELEKQSPLDLKKRPNLGILARIEDRRVPDRNFRYKWVGTESEKDELLGCLLYVLRTNPDMGRDIFQRIFDLNEISDPGVNRGVLGIFNRWVTRQRENAYRKKVRAERVGRDKIRKRHKRRERPVTIVAEGDSWFQFPFPSIGFWRLRWDIVKDIVDHFGADKNYRVLSLAAGGDWLSAMLQSSHYVSELSRIQPDFFLFSGGGNDLTTDGRLSFMVRPPSKPDGSLAELDAVAKDLFETREKTRKNHSMFNSKDYHSGLRCLTWEFFSLFNLLFLEYLLLLQNLSHEKFAELNVITHGYDFIRPRRRFWRFWWVAQWVENWLVASRWVFVPMQERRLDDENKRVAVYAIVSEFNELMIDLAVNSGHPRLFHIDCRGMARDDDWYDEIHLTSEAFGRVTELFKKCIGSVRKHGPLKTKKVFTEKDLYAKPDAEVPEPATQGQVATA